MGALANVERFLERLFERPAHRLPAGGGRQLRLQRRIERAVEASRRRVGGDDVVSSRFSVRLHPADLAGLGAPPEAVATELGDAVLGYVRQRRYIIAEQPRIELVADPTLARGDIEVGPPAVGTEPGGGPPDEGSVTAATSTVVLPAAEAQPRPGIATLLVDGPGDRAREVALDRLPLTIGRGGDNDLVLSDREVSRHHARIAIQRGSLVLSDLGSSNGSRVNGRPVSEVVLAVGDRIMLGRTSLVIRPGHER